MPGKAQQTEEWRDRYAENKRRDYTLMALQRIADALDRAYPPPTVDPPPASEPEPVVPSR